MKKILILFILIFFICSFDEGQKADYVYICGNSNVYHYDTGCEDIKDCESGIKKYLKNDLLKKGYKLCYLEGNAVSVYVCNGNSSTKYHYDYSCIGLSKCKADIFKVSKSDAIQHGRTLCGYEK